MTATVYEAHIANIRPVRPQQDLEHGVIHFEQQVGLLGEMVKQHPHEMKIHKKRIREAAWLLLGTLWRL